MPAIRVRDKLPNHNRQHRKNELWITIEKLNAVIYSIKEYNKIFVIICNDDYCEKLITPDSRNVFFKNKFEVQVPAEFRAKKTIVLKGIDSRITDRSNTDIQQELEDKNKWMKVEEIVEIPNAKGILKLVVSNVQMAKKAIEEGILMFNQSIPPRNIDSETIVNVRPCLKCYAFDHNTTSCPTPDIIVCSECSASGHRFDTCDPNIIKKCINCRGDHSTMAMRCPYRKELVKNKAKELRDKNKQKQNFTYADVASNHAQSQNPNQNMNIVNQSTLPPHSQLIIMTALCAADMKEKNNPGCFEDTVNSIFESNKMPKIRFPQGFKLDLRITMADMFSMAEEPQELSENVNDMETQQIRPPKRKDTSPLIPDNSKKQNTTEGATALSIDDTEDSELDAAPRKTRKKSKGKKDSDTACQNKKQSSAKTTSLVTKRCDNRSNSLGDMEDQSTKALEHFLDDYETPDFELHGHNKGNST